MTIKKIIKIDFFEQVKKYNGHELNDYYIYKIKINEYDADFIFSKNITNILGYNLKIMKYYYNDVEILEYLEYSMLFSNNKCKEII